MVAVDITAASYRSFSLQAIGQYKGPAIQIKPTIPDALDLKKVKLEQTSRDFGVESLYTLRFTPRNPIP